MRIIAHYMLIDLLGECIISMPLILILYHKFGLKTGKWKPIFLVLLLLYLSEVFIVVGIPAVQYIIWSPNGNLIPFHDYKNDRYMFQSVMNIILFLPLGVLLPLIWDKYRQFHKTFFAGLFTSLTIETLQAFSYRATDVDDLIMNTLGACIGYVCIWLIKCKEWKVREKETPLRWKKERVELLVVNFVLIITAIFFRDLITQLI